MAPLTATIRNLATRRRRQWVDVAFPKELVDATGSDTFIFGPLAWPAVRGIDIGNSSTLIHILADLQGEQILEAELIPRSFHFAFAPSEWVADDIQALVPRPMIKKNGVIQSAGPLFVETVESGTARVVWHLRARIENTMFVWDAWVYIYAMQDVVPVECILTCSDPRVPDLEETIGGAFVETGEYLHFDYATRLGMPAPARTDTWTHLLSGPRTIGDGEQLAYSGALLSLPNTTDSGPWWDVQLRVETLIAQSEAPMLGASTNWDGRWLAFRNTPVNPTGFPVIKSSDLFESFLSFSGDIYDPRPLGLGRVSTQSGAQEDFGASKGGAAATNHDPLWLYEARYSISEHLRPFHNREVDGSPVRAADHPNWATWSQTTFPIASPDRLGKLVVNNQIPPHGGSGWVPEDDQHRSQNNFNALYALSGSYAMKSVLEDFLQVDLAQIKDRAGAPRAQGRLMSAWASMLCLLDETGRALLKDHMLERMTTVENSWPGGPLPPSQPVRVLEHRTDVRTLTDAGGNAVPAWVVWEHSIAAMGYFAAWKATAEPRYLAMASGISRLVTSYGCFEEAGGWHACTAVRYLMAAQEGDALPLSSYRLDSQDVTIGNSFWTWTLPAVLIARELHPDLVARCDAIVASVAPSGALDWEDSEWWAV